MVEASGGSIGQGAAVAGCGEAMAMVMVMIYGRTGSESFLTGEIFAGFSVMMTRAFPDVVWRIIAFGPGLRVA